MQDSIIIKGARVHNLKNIDVEIPRNTMTVITGISGSGKSSLAFDTIYAEGQRRYVESLSSYARMFLGQMEKPDVDSIDGLSPAISIDQKTTSKNPRSTVGTVTEIYDYLRLLWARIGIPHCPKCGKEIRQQSVDQIIDQLTALPEGTRMQVLAPVIRGRKGEYQKVFEDARKSGFVRVRVDGSIYDLSEDIKLDKNIKHTIEIVVDRLVIKPDIARRLTDSVETATHLSGGLVVIDRLGAGEELTFSQNYACPDCGISIEELTPRMFSFNNPYGACPTCDGLGMKMEVDPHRIVPNGKLSLNQGALRASGFQTLDENSVSRTYMRAMSAKYGWSLDTPWEELPESARNMILYGTGTDLLDVRFSWEGEKHRPRPFEGVIPNMQRRYTDGMTTNAAKEDIEECMSAIPCAACKGRRLKKEVLAVTVGGKNIAEFTELSITEALNFVENLELTEKERQISDLILKEIRSRLKFLQNVGLEYLTLARSSGTLSGGESQRIRLATQIGSSLMGVLYVLDEPSIGLHQRDNDKLLATLMRLRDLGNTLIVVEHDEDTMLAADCIVDVGPGAGVHGGEIIATGTAQEIMQCENSLTGQYLSGARRIPLPHERRKGSGNVLTIRGACENNLKNLDVDIPLGTFTVVTGVSGSGKSSLINEVLYKALAAELNGARPRAGKHTGIDGLEHLDKVIAIDQSPIGRTPRSNPATYTGLFGDIRDLFSKTQDAKARGYGPGRFSFNVRGGRCESCAGDGLIKIEMHFLPDIYVPCDVCKGKRYNRETLEVKYKDKNIYEVLDMTVAEALPFFENISRIRKKLQTLYDVGLSYIKLGQSSTTLSGGEAQRVKLATELSRKATGRTIYILDEPTTGLHSYDVHKLIEVLQKLVEGGNSVVVIEHNLDVIKTADHIIDLGPEGGSKGGLVVASGTPEEVAQTDGSYTGQYLKKALEREGRTL
ncbi:MAG: excinuclease ABC subunit UvrA [Clostridia bacterium]|nr:excinuclease ABC subunit UvrA [Clostridia bacterium]